MEKCKKNFSTHVKLFVLTVFVVNFAIFLSQASNKVIENVDYLYMHIGLEMDYPLPESFKKERLRFEGNYKRYTTATYRKSHNDIRFKPKRRGSAVMIIKNQDNKIVGRLHIDIQKDNLHKIAAELRDLLIAIDGIEVKIYNKKVIIDGQVLLPREMDRIRAVISKYQSELVQSLVTYSPEAQKKIAEIIEKEIGYPEVTVRYAYNRFLLEGCVNSDTERNRAIKIANLYTQFEVSPVGKGATRKGIPILKDDITICESEKKAKEEEKQKEEIKKLVQIVVHFVEMDKSFNKGFVFEWSPAIGDDGTSVVLSTGNVPGAPKGVSAHLQATVQNFLPKLNWVKSFNFARVLHNSSILVEEGTQGKITLRTEVPLKRPNQKESSKTSAEVTTAVTPEIQGERNNLIRLDIGVVVTASAGESTTARTVKTAIHVRDGASAVIGGLISSSLRRGYGNQPEGRSPILNLHSSKNYDTSKSQFVVFITPLIKSSASIGVERIKRKFKLDE